MASQKPKSAWLAPKCVRPTNYSCRSVIAGSTRAARNAGRATAATEMPNNIRAAASAFPGSSGLVLYNSDAIHLLVQ